MTDNKRDLSWLKFPLITAAVLAAVLLIGLLAMKILQPLLPAEWTARTPTEYVEKTTAAKVSAAKLVFHEDTHGGFHGDGHTLIVFDCAEAGDDFENSLSAWRELPLSAKLQDELCYDNGSEVDLGEVFMRHGIAYGGETPKVKDGLYFLNNRHSRAKSSEDENLFNYSVNFTFAVYDRETKTLYYMEVDT